MSKGKSHTPPDDGQVHGEFFVITPLALLHSPHLSDGAKLLWQHMYWRYSARQAMFETRRSIAEYMGKTPRTITTLIAELASAEWIVIDEQYRSDGGQQSNFYHVFTSVENCQRWKLTQSNSATPLEENFHPPLEENFYGGWKKISTHKEDQKYTDHITTTTTTNDSDLPMLGNDLPLVDSFAETSSAASTPSTSPTSHLTGNSVSQPLISPVSKQPATVPPVPVPTPPKPVPTLPPAAVVSNRFTQSRYHAFNERECKASQRSYTAKEAAAKAPELEPHGYVMVKGSVLNARPDADSIVLVKNSSTSTLFDVFAEYSFGIKQGQGISERVGARIGAIIKDFAELLVRTDNDVKQDRTLANQVKECFEAYKKTKPSGFDLPNTGPSFIKWWNRWNELATAPVTSNTASATSGFKMQ